MLHPVNKLKGYTLDSLDGEIGKVKEFYFDDALWTIRYLVADTGHWLSHRQVLISPHALIAAVQDEKRIQVKLTKKQIEESPSLDSDKPVSRQFESSYNGHFGWSGHWKGTYPMPGINPYFGITNPPVPTSQNMPVPTIQLEEGDPHLRSTKDITGYHIEAQDGAIGHLEDILIDDETWMIRYLVIDTNNWWPGKKVLISPQWIERVLLEESKVFINLTRESIKNSPEYTETSLVTRDYELKMHTHYKRDGYWVKEKSNV